MKTIASAALGQSLHRCGFAMLRSLAAYIWPISRKSAPTWIAFVGTMYIFWARVFLVRRETNAVRVKKQKQKLLVEEQILSINKYVAREHKKPETERKMPEASRVYSLLWDKVHGCRMTTYGVNESSDAYQAVVNLLKESISRELLKCIDLTQRARETKRVKADGTLALQQQAGGKTDTTEAAEDIKAVAEHESGEKLKVKIVFLKEITRNLGPDFVDLKEEAKAKMLLKTVKSEQQAQHMALVKLLKPLAPKIAFVISIATINGMLRGVFHQIRYWLLAIEQVGTGDLKAGTATLLFLWGGHLLIQSTDLLETTFAQHVESKLGQSVRNGVLNAMVRQDFEYFYRNSPGVLQDRLNRDANQLGNNVIRFPARNCARVANIVTIIVQLWINTPGRLLVPALVPMLIMSTTMRYTFKAFHRMHQRQRRVEEASIKATSEVLREIKTVRQFAMEANEAANYMRAGITKHEMVEGCFVLRESLNRLLWSFFDSGLALTIFMGFPFLQSGALSVTDMTDLWCKVSFNLTFGIQALINDMQQAQQLLEPLGRICDLLDAKPLIEPNPATDPNSIEIETHEQLSQLLDMCEVKHAESASGWQRKRTVASAQLADAKPGDNSLFWPEKGQQLVSVMCADYEYVQVFDASSIQTQKLEYPVRLTFSTKLRPLKFKGKIEFKDVVFRYPTDLRKPVLRKMSFVVEPGQKVALVGSTGCGKSTCMQLLQRMYTPLDGQILIDDIPIEDYDVNYLRSRIVIVDQHTVLFNASIRDNIAYGVDVSDEEIIQALKDAKIWDFVEKEPDQLLSVIAEGGSNLSGGQRQRLAIARAMVRKPDVILLDEATSALDNESEAGVQEALDALARKGSALVIAHRLSTIMDSDKIYVLGGTRDGTHDELLNMDATKAAIAAGSSDAPEPLAASGLPATRPLNPGELEKIASGQRRTPQIAGSITGSESLATCGLPAPRSLNPGELENVLRCHPKNPKLAVPRTTNADAKCGLASKLRASTVDLECPPLGRTLSMPTTSTSKEQGNKLTSYKGLWEAATGKKETNMTLAGMEEKCRNMHDEWLHLKKRVDSIRDLHRALVLPSQPVTQAADEPTKQKETSTKNGDTLGVAH